MHPQYRGVEQLVARRAHNPEVVGSSPASATIKNTGFRKKSGVFLTFWHKMKMLKMGLELVLELVAETPKTKNRENLTFCIFIFLENDIKKPSVRRKNLAEG